MKKNEYEVERILEEILMDDAHIQYGKDFLFFFWEKYNEDDIWGYVVTHKNTRYKFGNNLEGALDFLQTHHQNNIE